jgi:poly(A) polymerase
MEKESRVAERVAEIGGALASFPAVLIDAISSVARTRSLPVYIVGGTLRDWLLGCIPHDLDLTVASGAEGFSRDLIAVLGSGTLVRLGTDNDEAVRVVWQGLDIDISAFRGKAITLAQDLALRDFTVNGMAVELSEFQQTGNAGKLIDPLGGLRDLKSGLLRHCPHAFQDDPLRLLRAYRFMATLGFQLDAITAGEVRSSAAAILEVAAERVRYELDLIMQSDRSSVVLWKMHEVGLLQHILPELYAGEGVEQPDFHHLDVFHHNFQALREMEQILSVPEMVYPEQKKDVHAYLVTEGARVTLKWVALLHDIAKPAARGEAVAGGVRVTFHGHDEMGREQFDALARRLKWSNESRKRAGDLIAMHMHPFHLCNVRREAALSRRAALKICRRAGDQLPGLFLLAMADSLASRGELKPENMEDELVALYCEVAAMYDEYIRPALSGPPLLGGKDLIEDCQLQPGPIFSKVLDELQALQVEGQITTKEQALAWVARFLDDRKDEVTTGCR